MEQVGDDRGGQQRAPPGLNQGDAQTLTRPLLDADLGAGQRSGGAGAGQCRQSLRGARRGQCRGWQGLGGCVRWGRRTSLQFWLLQKWSRSPLCGWLAAAEGRVPTWLGSIPCSCRNWL